MKYDVTIYDKETGEISMVLSTPIIEEIFLNTKENEDFVLGENDPESVYISRGSPEAKPPKPEGDFWRYDARNKLWFDPRDKKERRNAKLVARVRLIMALVQEGHLPEAEAVEAARGMITPRLEGLSLADQVAFAGGVTFRRTDAIVTKLQIVLNITPAEMDAVFDIAIGAEST